MDYYLILIVIILILGVFGIIVGVANDAVNFLNSSLGSKVTSLKVILFIASLGILAGVTFSSGMMEIARKGIFNPEQFVFNELIIIFFAVGVQNILLLDFFNTYGLPTSTTVSVVFGLLGSALGVSIIKIITFGNSLNSLYSYINTGEILAIISAIFVSILFAFIFGSITQWISRLIFTFNYKRNLSKYGSIWGGIAITMIVYFIVIKGAKGSSFLSNEDINCINNHVLEILIYGWLGSSVLLQILYSIFKVNILKIIVLLGTFALAMAFAANDLVNFIGAPLASLNAYHIASQFNDISLAPMGELAKPIKGNTLILLASGLVMVLTLIFSKKARTVSRTEINLGRQDEGYERFQSYMLSRILVRFVIQFIDFLKKITPKFIRERISRRFDLKDYKSEIDENGETPAFDLVRAAVNLVVATALISYGTSLKLPLSTTYVTFIVAMSTALPDKAWGRESAVYRVSGVMTVVGGWLFTAIIATVIAGLVSFITFYGQIYAFIGFSLLSLYFIYRSSQVHKKREKEVEERENSYKNIFKSSEEIKLMLFEKISDYLKSFKDIVSKCFDGIEEENLKSLNKAYKKAKKLYKNADFLISDVLKSLKFATDEQLEQSHNYAKALGSLHEMASRIQYITEQSFKYFDNNHQKFQDEQIEEIRIIEKEFKKIMENHIIAFQELDLGKIKDVQFSTNKFEDLIIKFNKNQIKRIKKSTANKKRSILFLNILDDTHGIILNLQKVSRAFYDFYCRKD